MNRTFHAQGGISEDQLSAESLKYGPPLEAHGGRHGKNKPVALCSRYEGQSYAGVTARGFNQHTLSIKGIHNSDRSAKILRKKKNTILLIHQIYIF